MFITLEGIEGSGKTTQIVCLVEFLTKRGHDCVTTREPGGTKIGEKIRAILLSSESGGMDPMTELLLYTADRAQHVKESIIPYLDSGKTVICDRFYDATVVYQGYARGLDMDVIDRLHTLATGGLKPDLTFLLDLPAEMGLSRAWTQINNGSRTGSETRFEEEKLSFHEKVRTGYLDLVRLEPDRFRMIDASKEIAHVRTSMMASLDEYLIGKL